MKLSPPRQHDNQFDVAALAEAQASPLMHKLGHLLLHLLALQLLLQEDLEAGHRGGALGVLLVGLWVES